MNAEGVGQVCVGPKLLFCEQGRGQVKEGCVDGRRPMKLWLVCDIWRQC